MKFPIWKRRKAILGQDIQTQQENSYFLTKTIKTNRKTN